MSCKEITHRKRGSTWLRLVPCLMAMLLAIAQIGGCPSESPPPDDAQPTDGTVDGGTTDGGESTDGTSDGGTTDGGQTTDGTGDDGTTDGAQPDGTGEPAEPELPAGTIQETISAGGGAFVGDTGIELDVPAGALTEDADLTITPLSEDELADLGDDLVVGVVLEPEGLEFDDALTLRVPLEEPWPDGEPIYGVMAFGDDLSAGAYVEDLVELSEDRSTAVFHIEHFSSVGASMGNGRMMQCHAGTREYLLAEFARRNCNYAEFKLRVEAKYPGVTIAPEGANEISDDEIQAILGTFFVDAGAADAGNPVPDGLIADLQNHMIEAKLDTDDYFYNVVVMYWPTTSGNPDPANRFFCPVDIAHSTAVELYQDQWQLRNSLYVKKGSPVLPYLRVNAGVSDLGAMQNLLWWPFDDLETFRALKTLEAVELQRPAPDNHSNSLYGVIPGLRPIDRRSGRWGAVRLYKEVQDNNPWLRLTGCWKFDVTEDGETSTVLLRIDHDGDLDSMWFGASYQAGEEPPGWDLNDKVFIEMMRFTNKAGRQNAPGIADDLRNVYQNVTESADHTGFTISFGWQRVESDDDGNERLAETVDYAITGAQFLPNIPEEKFTGTFEKHEVDYEYDDEGHVTTTPEDVVLTSTGERVLRPNSEDGTGVTQEDFIARINEIFETMVLPGFESLFGSLAALCGTGFVGFLPLTIAGVAGLKCAGRIRRRR